MRVMFVLPMTRKPGWSQKRRLKQNHFRAVLNALKPFQEADSVSEKQAPVRATYQHLHNRPQHLDYKGSIVQEVPIGSGEIESAHRYIIQILVETLWSLVDS
jgi:hypothetical protein